VPDAKAADWAQEVAALTKLDEKRLGSVVKPRGMSSIRKLRSLDSCAPTTKMANMTWKTGSRVESPSPSESAPLHRWWRWRLVKIIDHPLFDCFMGLIIVLNVVCVFVQFEWKGLHTAHSLQLRDNDGGWPDAEKVFQGLEIMFGAIYALELAARIYLLRSRFLRSIWNVIDMVIVVVSCVDAWILTPMAESGETLEFASIVKLLRIARVLRAVKVLRFMSMFTELRVMFRSFSSSLSSLLWSMLILVFIIIAGGILMVQLTLSFVEDEGASTDLRTWVFLEFGTAARATWTLFEATFTTNWPTKARTLVMEVSPWFSIFWVPYTIMVNFAFMRVIAALFLKHTLAASNLDDHKLSMRKMQEKEAFAEKIRQIFMRSDKLGDGVLHGWEFESMMEDQEVMEMFKKLEMSTDEILTLHEILSDRDGVVDYEELLSGALKMKNSNQTLDIIEVMHEQMSQRRAVEKLHTDVRRFFGAFLAGGRAEAAGRGPSHSSVGAEEGSTFLSQDAAQSLPHRHHRKADNQAEALLIRNQGGNHSHDSAFGGVG